MRQPQVLVSALVLTLAACSAGTKNDPVPSVSNEGLSLTASTKERLAGSFKDAAGTTVLFDAARVNEDVFLDVKNATGLQIIHLETTAKTYEFSYMNGQLRMHADKAWVAAQRAATEQAPPATSTEGFVWEGDMNALDQMMQLPEVALLPHLSRALGADGFTGSEFPASLALHQIARQSAEGLGIQVQPIEAQAANGYCTAYPNQNNGCYGMCGPGCTCWSWVCGDCCYHNGCARHDDWCRQGQWYYCYNITAVIALFGC